MFNQGYIGITSQTVKARYNCHKSHAKNGKVTHLYAAMRRHGNSVIVETILEGSLEYCQDVEFKLRPTLNLAWNTGIGGEKPTIGYKHSDESKAKIAAAGRLRVVSDKVRRRSSEVHKGRVVSAETRKKMSESNKARMPWQNAAANHSVWVLAQQLCTFIKSNEDKTVTQIGKNFGLTPNQVANIIRKLKAGWIPSEDSAYMSWLTEYKEKECYGT